MNTSGTENLARCNTSEGFACRERTKGDHLAWWRPLRDLRHARRSDQGGSNLVYRTRRRQIAKLELSRRKPPRFPTSHWSL